MHDATDSFAGPVAADVDPRSLYTGIKTEPVPSAAELGHRLRLLREREGLSLEEVAHRTGCSPTAISRFEEKGEASAGLLLDLVRTMTSSSNLSDAFMHPRFLSIEDVVKSARRNAR